MQTAHEGYDYLVVGAGAAGMSVVDELLSHSDARILLVDRRHRPGGHWVDAYPFVRLHQPSSYYGVNSRPLGHDRIDTSGPNAGFYERASAQEICDYYQRVLDERFLDSGRVTFLGKHDYRGRDGDAHVIVSHLTGKARRVAARRLIDASYVESVIPSRHTPSFAVDPATQFLTPNQLVDHTGDASEYTVLGGGKTAMDTCVWLLEQGVDPDRIRWVRPRDGWFVDRTYVQSLDLIGSMMAYQAATIETVAEVDSGLGFARRLEEQGMMFRLDPSIDPPVFRGATLSRLEQAQLLQIENVVRLGRVEAIGEHRVRLSDGELPTGPNVVHIDCTAGGLPDPEIQPIFQPGMVRVQPTTAGVSPWSAAMVGFVETLDLDDGERNRLCPTIRRSGLIDRQLALMAVGYCAEPLRRANPDLAAWNAAARLNPGRPVADHLEEPDVRGALERMLTSFEPALQNLQRWLPDPP
ncbi:MAG: NAD(P)-binding protein [Actinomycetota bacterium]